MDKAHVNIVFRLGRYVYNLISLLVQEIHSTPFSTLFDTGHFFFNNFLYRKFKEKVCKMTIVWEWGL